MRSICGLCGKELKCFRTINNGVCSVCEKSGKRRIGYYRARQRLQNGTSSIRQDQLKRFYTPNISPINSLSNVYERSDKKFCATCDKLPNGTLHEGDCFDCFSEKRRISLNKLYDELHEITAKKPCQSCSEETCLLKEGKCIVCRFKEST